MKRSVVLGAIFAAALASPAIAALHEGAKAPDFTAQASLGGKEYTFSLADALKKGPVVLYFYPAAFTKGCTIEAHDFADAMPQYAALGATVIGVSHDKIDTLDRFSVSECRSKFPVAADPDETVIKSYDAVLASHPEYANRTSYVIAPDHSVLMTYTDMNPDKHVELTLAAVKKWHDAQGSGQASK
ncbi:MAG TPA: peroxiredoxin [Rhizomicrobium sp.]|jgi:peroxiredoxin|nr:peroxiredoxin [Rhizomicrobium sp.]